MVPPIAETRPHSKEFGDLETGQRDDRSVKSGHEKRDADDGVVADEIANKLEYIKKAQVRSIR